MSRVATGSRLHFGLFNLGSGPRRFGGVGLMIEAPGIVLSARPASQWSARGPLAERALAYARRLTVEPHDIVIEQAAPEHVGLGTGTQLALAVGRALVAAEPLELARRLGRGQRSAIGSHGFQHGGFLVESGKVADEISPLAQRCDFPADWEIMLAMPAWTAGLHGQAEQRAFDHLPPGESLQRLIHEQMLPACQRGDLESFGEALYAFNRQVGERFAAAQGGVYAHPRLAELVEFIRGHGIRGVGQSSWGPTLFAVTRAGRARELAQAVRARFALADAEVLATAARNHGAEVTEDQAPAQAAHSSQPSRSIQVNDDPVKTVE